jgi:hypothetical protein
MIAPVFAHDFAATFPSGTNTMPIDAGHAHPTVHPKKVPAPARTSKAAKSSDHQIRTESSVTKSKGESKRQQRRRGTQAAAGNKSVATDRPQ